MERKAGRGPLGHPLLLADQGQRVLIGHQAEGNVAMPQILLKPIGGAGLHDSVNLVIYFCPQLVLLLRGQRLVPHLLKLSADRSDALQHRVLLGSLIYDNIGKQMMHSVPPD